MPGSGGRICSAPDPLAQFLTPFLHPHPTMQNTKPKRCRPGHGNTCRQVVQGVPYVVQPGGGRNVKGRPTQTDRKKGARSSRPGHVFNVFFPSSHATIMYICIVQKMSTKPPSLKNPPFPSPKLESVPDAAHSRCQMFCTSSPAPSQQDRDSPRHTRKYVQSAARCAGASHRDECVRLRRQRAGRAAQGAS